MICSNKNYKNIIQCLWVMGQLTAVFWDKKEFFLCIPLFINLEIWNPVPFITIVDFPQDANIINKLLE